MNDEQFVSVAATLRAAYPSNNFLTTKDSISIWHEMLQDLPYEVAQAAAKEYIGTSQYPPTIAEIRAKSLSYTHKPVMDYGEAWGTVLKAIRKYGYMEEVSALESLDEITRKCVERLGYQNICHDEDEAATRANFRMIYEQEANRTKQNNQLPVQLQTQKQHMIEQIVPNTAQKIEKKEEPHREHKTADMDNVSALLDGLRRN
jgi:hypothetical protein